MLQWLKDTTKRVITGTDEARRVSLGTDPSAGIDPTVKLHSNGATKPADHT